MTETNLLRSKSEPCETLADVCEFFDVFKHKINFSGLEDFTLINFLCGNLYLKTFNFHHLMQIIFFRSFP